MSDSIFEQAMRALKDLTDHATMVHLTRTEGGGYECLVDFPNRPTIKASGPKLLTALIDCRELAARDAKPCEACAQVVLDGGKRCLEHR